MNFFPKTNQAGQTLVETVVGVFVLTIGISTAVGLAAAMFSATSSAVKQVIASGLAREGVEAVFNMRGTNWLKGQLDDDCYDYTTGSSNAYCHQDWLNPAQTGSYDLTPPSGSRSYTIDADVASTGNQPYWVLTQQPPGNPQYRLYYDSNATSGLYYKTSSGGAVPSEYYREVLLEMEDSTVPYYNASIGPRLKVASRVWWTDKGCQPAAQWAQTVPKCRIELVSYLTNWRNY